MSSHLKKVRDIERMIKKFGASPEALAKLEEAKHGKELSQKREKMKKNSTKYHMVKFLERKKLTRIIRGLDGKLKNVEEGSAEAVELNKRRDKNLNDLAYVMYYPIEHKYIALFPSNTPTEDSDAEEQDDEKSKLLSKKAREVALQRWAEDKERIAAGAEGVFDKVAYAMEVEYKGGAVAAEGLPAKLMPAPQEKKKAAAEKPAKKQSKTAAASVGKIDSAPASLPKTTTATSNNNSSDSSSSSESDSEGSDSDSSDSDSAPSAPVKTAVTAAPAQAEASDSEEGDAFFVEEASESELPQTNSKHPQQPKVYNDGNSFRYKEERRSVHEIRFAATKRKYERHKRVFNNQNKRNSAQDRKKSRSGGN